MAPPDLPEAAGRPGHVSDTHRRWFDLAERLTRIAAWEVDVVTGATVWSPGLHRIVGCDPTTFNGTLDEVLAYMHPEDAANVPAQIEAMRRGADQQVHHARFIRPDGTIRWVRAEAEFNATEGKLVGVVQDITDEVAANEAHRLHTEVIDTLDESVAVIALGTPMRIVDINARAATVLGRHRSDVLGLSPNELLNGLGDEPVAALAAALAGDGHWRGDIHATTTLGEQVVRLRISPVTLVDGNPGLLLVGADVTEARSNERSLLEERERARVAQDYAPLGMAIADGAGHIIEVNDALRHMYRLSPDAPLTDYTIAARLSPDEITRHEAALARVITGDLPAYQMEASIRRGDGTDMCALVTVAGVRTTTPGPPRYIIGQVLDITARKIAEEQLRRHAEEVRSANEAKTEFLSRVSHELRTPLNAVLGYAQLLELANLAGDEGDAAGHILRAGRHLLSLIDELLDTTRLEAGELRIELGSTPVRAVITEAVALVEPTAERHQVTIHDNTPDSDELLAWVDRRRLVQVLVNLLTNAVKYNRPGGTVDLGASTDANGRVRVTVADTGVGIDPGGLDRIFDPFERLGAEQTAIEGSGIGLPLSKSLTEHMGGELTATSEIGVGSTFTIILPASDRRETPLQLVDKVEARSGTPAAERLTVVNVEDNLVNRLLIDAVFTKRPGVEVRHATNGTTGLELIDAAQPELVLLDLQLPDMSGFDVLARLRSQPGRRPVVAILSADASEERVDTALALGADHYLTKPFDVPGLLRLVDDTAAGMATTRDGVRTRA